MLVSLLLACVSQTIGTDTAGTGSDPTDTAADTADTSGGDTADTQDTGGDDTAVDTGDTNDTGGDTDTVDTDPSNDVDPASLVGRVYDFNINDATISPEGLGSVMSGQITQDLLLEVASADASSIAFLGALSVSGDPGAQDYCAQTMDITGGSLVGNPDFSVGPTNLTMDVAGNAITLTDVYLSGTFSADLSEIVNGEMNALIDSRPLDSAFGLNEGDICSYGSMLGFKCQACADGEDFCIAFSASKIRAEYDSKLDLVDVAGTNCEGCESGPPAVDAVCQ